MLWLAVEFFGVPVVSLSAAFVAEVQRSVFWIVPSIPLLLLATVLRGHLEAIGAFRALNAVRIPTGVFLVVGPCLAAWYKPDLEVVCISILLVRLVHALALLQRSAHELRIPAHRILPVLLGSWNPRWLTPLLSFGGWVSVSNVLGPVIVYADRFVLGATVAASAVAVYAIPLDVVSRLPVITASLGAVLLPELVRLHGPAGLRGDARLLLQRAYKLSLLVLLPVLLGGWFVMHLALSLWIDAEFAQQAGFAAQVLLLAFSINALSQITFAALQSAGRVRALALLHTAELLPYLLFLWFAVSAWGVVGAAYACLARNCVDLAALLWLNRGTSAAIIPHGVV
jgi:O-antigen/teichoic acid export membrane protein